MRADWNLNDRCSFVWAGRAAVGEYRLGRTLRPECWIAAQAREHSRKLHPHKPSLLLFFVAA
jgi:hypothetical protein